MDRHYATVKTYFAQNGNLRDSKRYETNDSLKLDAWMVNQQQLYQKSKQQKERMNADRIRLLNELDVLWKTD